MVAQLVASARSEAPAGNVAHVAVLWLLAVRQADWLDELVVLDGLGQLEHRDIGVGNVVEAVGVVDNDLIKKDASASVTGPKSFIMELVHANYNGPIFTGLIGIVEKAGLSDTVSGGDDPLVIDD